MTSGRLRAEGFLVLPAPHPIFDAKGNQWAGYNLDQAKQLLTLDDEMYSLRLQKDIWGEARKGYEGQVVLLKELLVKEGQKFDLLQARFDEKAKTLDKAIEEKNQYKYQRKWALFGGRASLLPALLILGLGAASIH